MSEEKQAAFTQLWCQCSPLWRESRWRTTKICRRIKSWPSIAKVDSNVCDVSIPDLRNYDNDLLAKIEELNVTLAGLRNENEKLLAKAKELDVCNITISDLRDKNDILRAKIVVLNSCKPFTSTVEHTIICTRCRDVDINAMNDHLTMIKEQNDHCWGPLSSEGPKKHD